MIVKVTEADYPELIAIWESAVLSTHDFLSREDFEFFKSNLCRYLSFVDLYAVKYESRLAGFIGVAQSNIEMLFVHDDFRGRGVGTELLTCAIEQLGARCVDVNEHNQQAVGFYEHMGFATVSRSPHDSEGRPYPILHMELNRA